MKQPSSAWAFLQPVVVLTSICFIVAACLVTTNYFTKPVIEEMNARIKNQASQSVLPGADTFTKIEGFDEEILNLGGVDAYRADNGAGIVVTVSSKGFGGQMELIVGYNPEGTVTGVQVLSASETPGVGSNALTEEYLSQYINLTGQASFDGAEGENQVDAVSGATVTSKAVLKGMNTAEKIFQLVKGAAA